MIRVGLLPLERIGRVASEIAHGNLSKRVTPANDRTEVGRLGTSLNEMLAQIEDAFADRSRSEERLRRFLADASHELRTPLASIRGYAELFRLGAAREPAEIQRAMERIEAEATRMGGLVESLLLLARLEELPETPLVEVDLTELAEHAARTRARRRQTVRFSSTAATRCSYSEIPSSSVKFSPISPATPSSIHLQRPRSRSQSARRTDRR